jgi:hypothetical protein
MDDWVAFCVVSASFDAFADDVASFDCVTLPSFPGLSTRTEIFEFEGWIWVALDAAIAPCPMFEDCVLDCTGSAANAVPALTARAANVAASVVTIRFIS